MKTKKVFSMTHDVGHFQKRISSYLHALTFTF